MLTQIKGVLSADEVKAFRNQMDKADWVDGKATAGSQSGSVKMNQQLPANGALCRELGERIVAKLGHNALFLSAALPKTILPPLFNRYGMGQAFGSHVDNSIRVIQGTQLVMRTDLSATLFLSDQQDYEGGELVIETEFGKATVKLDAGDLVLYPAHSIHHVTQITQGCRVAAFFWVQSLVADTQCRRQLFDLDTCIQELTDQLGAQHATVLRLTQLYHNLIRKWATV